MNFITIVFALLLNIFSLQQADESKGVLKGTIIDDLGEPLPGASIIVKGQQLGTSTNYDGEYELKLSPGKHIISYLSLGFTTQEYEVTFTADKTLEHNIKLLPASIQISEVKIMSGGEDPAYPIMRKAIAMSPYHARQIKKYNADIYLRGTLQIEKIPRVIRRQIEKELNNTKLEIGKAYSIESFNEIEYTAPDSFKHTVKHTQTNFDIPSFNSPVPYMNSNFYSSSNEMFISPLSSQAMRHYKFRYIGYTEDAGQIINKIEVIPRRKSQQLVKGELYMIDELWSIHSLDLTLTTLYGDVNIKQVYAPIKNHIWLPINHTFNITASMIGTAANARYVASVKYNNIVEESDILTPTIIAAAKIFENKEEDIIEEEEEELSKTEQKIKEISEKEELTNRDMNKLVSLTQKSIKERERERETSLEIVGTYKIDVDDSTIKSGIENWEQLRPIPLTKDEQKSFEKESYQPNVAVNDTTDKKKKSNLLSTFIWAGSIYEKNNDRLRYNGLIDFKGLSFNSVDGLKYHQRLRLRYYFNDTHRFIFNIKGDYAFSRKDFGGHVLIQQNYALDRRGTITLFAESGSKDFKNNEAINPWTNSISSLFLKDNYTKWYKEKKFIVKNQIDITNGFEFHLGASFNKYYELSNNTNFSLLYKNKKYIDNSEVEQWSNIYSEAFTNQKAFITEMTLKYTPRYYYKIENGQKKMLYSNYPTFVAHIEYSDKILNTDNQYLFMEAEVYKREENMFAPTWSWKVASGGFLQNNSVHFSRFKHFKGANDYFFFESINELFLIADYYSTSTNRWYVQGSVTHSSPWLFLKNLPLISQTLWNENLHLNYLHTPYKPHHVQAGYSISQIFVFMEAGAFIGFTDGKYDNFGFRLTLKL